MFSTEFLLKLINRDKTSQYIYTLLFISLIVVFDFFALFVFGNLISVYLYLAIISILSLLGVSFLIKLIKNTIITINKKHDDGEFPQKEFNDISTMFFASIFIVFPGIITSIFGLILLFPVIRQIIGKYLTIKFGIDWNAVYEYKEIYNS